MPKFDPDPTARSEITSPRAILPKPTTKLTVNERSSSELSHELCPPQPSPSTYSENEPNEHHSDFTTNQTNMEGAFIPTAPSILPRTTAFTPATSPLQAPATSPSRPRPTHLHTSNPGYKMTAASASPPDTETTEEDWPSAQTLSSSNAPGTVLAIEDIMKILPHRHPFLLLDRVIAYEPGKRAIGVKAVTVSEPFFPGHFPDRPIMPGVLQVEALAQLGGIVMLQPPFVEPGAPPMDFFFGGVDRVKWRKPVIPGDTLILEMELVSFKQSFGIAKMQGKGYVDGKLAVEGMFTLVMVRDK